MSDYRRILDMKDIDGVLVASPLHIHARHFLDTLAAGKDLYSEKTMTWSIPEADQCLEAAKNPTVWFKSDCSTRAKALGRTRESGFAMEWWARSPWSNRG